MVTIALRFLSREAYYGINWDYFRLFLLVGFFLLRTVVKLFGDSYTRTHTDLKGNDHLEITAIYCRLVEGYTAFYTIVSNNLFITARFLVQHHD